MTLNETLMLLMLREAAKKVLFLMAGPLRPNPPPPPPSSLMAVGTLERWKKEVPKKVIFSLIARLLREDLFYAAYITDTLLLFSVF